MKPFIPQKLFILPLTIYMQITTQVILNALLIANALVEIIYSMGKML